MVTMGLSAGHYEMPPYSNDTMRSVYHVREFEVFKLMQVRTPPLLLYTSQCTLTTCGHEVND
jgi:hypothetical protein